MWSVSVSDTRFPHRLSTATISLHGPDGPLRNVAVRVRQTRHDFLFGNIGFDLMDMANGSDDSSFTAELAADYLELFNATTLPFYLGRFEPERNCPYTVRTMKAARWFKDRGVVVKGHPLVWHTITPDWLDALPLDEADKALRHRIRRDVSDFEGIIDMWDAINEVVIMPHFDKKRNDVTDLAMAKDRLYMIRMAFEEAKAANKGAYLLLNDFDLSWAYECVIEGALEAGIPIDAIGLQTHMHQGYKGEDYILEKVEAFARYGLPIHMTETSLVSGHLMDPSYVDLNDCPVHDWPSTPEGEERQCDEIIRHYTSLISHPAVQCVTYWGVTDRGAWLGAPIGLVRADGSHKPSYDALKSLVKGDWWVSDTSGCTDNEGQFELTGFLGDYEIEVAGVTHPIRLDHAGDTAMEISVVAV